MVMYNVSVSANMARFVPGLLHSKNGAFITFSHGHRALHHHEKMLFLVDFADNNHTLRLPHLTAVHATVEDVFRRQFQLRTLQNLLLELNHGVHVISRPLHRIVMAEAALATVLMNPDGASAKPTISGKVYVSPA